MADYTAVISELSLISGYEQSELDNYSSLIEGLSSSVFAQLKDSQSETDNRVIHMAACKCYYHLLLLNQSENLTSFKAGDISYTMSSAAADGARELYEQSVKDCAELLKDSSFAFKAV